VPALNESQNLVLAVDEIVNTFEGTVRNYEILIFDDNSSDDTPKLADELASKYPNTRAFHNKKRLNIGGNYKEGLKVALYDYIVLIPGDNEAMPNQIIRALEYLTEADIVAFFHKNDHIRSPKRRVISRVYTVMVNFLFGTNFSYTNDTNVWKKAVLDTFTIKTGNFSYQTEALVKAIRQGNDFIEMGNTIRNRRYGSTNLNFLKSAYGVLTNIARLWIEVNIRERKKYNKMGQKIRRIT